MKKTPSLAEGDLKRMGKRMRERIAKRLGQLKKIEKGLEKDLSEVRGLIKDWEDQAEKWVDR